MAWLPLKRSSGPRLTVKLVGRLRTFWISFENLVMGINPFSRIGSPNEHCFLVSLCAKRSGDIEVPFNYHRARDSIRLACSLAGEAA